MPRDFMPLYASIWADDDFRSLPPQAQHTYFLIASQANVTACGVYDAPLRRLLKAADGLTVDYLQRQVDALCEDRFLIVDDDTGEILVRSYIRWDGLLKMGSRPAKAIAKSYRVIDSPIIRTAVLDELRKIHDGHPKLAGWTGISEEDPALADLIGITGRGQIRAIK